MQKLTCEICGQVFEYKKLSSCRAQLTRHLDVSHKIKLEDYIVKYYYNGHHPICPCGCGEKLHLAGWKFNQYAKDTCIGNLVKNANDELKAQIKWQSRNKFDIKQYYKEHYDYKSYKDAFDLFASKKFPLTDVSKQYKIDKRTLKLVWINLGISSLDEITKLTDFYRYDFILETKGIIESEPNDIYTWMYRLIKMHPQKYNINSLIKYYNDKHDQKLHKTVQSVYLTLKKLYGDEIDIYLSYGLHSSEEFAFYNVLKFYLSNASIVIGKRFELINNYIVFDFFINQTLLIEYDSVGKFHDDKYRDLMKENFAKNNNYKFLRLSKDDILDISTIDKIKKLLYD